MPIVTFLGLLHPLELRMTASTPQSYKCTIPETGVQLECAVHIVNSEIRAICEVDRYDEKEVLYLFKEATYVTRTFVNCMAFSKGEGVTIAFDKMITPQMEVAELLLTDYRLPKLCTSYTFEENLDEIMIMVMTTPGLNLALDDLVQAISSSRMVPLNCARAVEALRHLFSTPDAPRQKAWAAMRESLRISEEYISLITTHSVAPRHGDVTGVAGETVLVILQRSWTIMNRYIAFRRRGGIEPLPLIEFPLLLQ